MINLSHKRDCCGCHACMSICPKSCISMRADEEGFLYPFVDEQACIDCGLCEKVCPVINQSEPRRPIEVYAAKSSDEAVRRDSSSGGVFTVVAEGVISDGGVVFGAKFDKEWRVVHAWTDTIEGLVQFRGSKYVQSCIGNAYKEAEQFLTQGRRVLFTGTPCQVAGLKKYLRKEYDNLTTIDVVCHGVPSPLVWHEYLKELVRTRRTDGKNSVSSSLNDLSVIADISFRDKTMGWKKFGFKIGYVASKATENTVSKSVTEHSIEPFYDNLYMKGFLRNLYLRPSCYACASKSGKSGSDLTIADFWGVEKSHPELNDEQGVSALLVYNEDVELGDKMEKVAVEYNDVLSSNTMIERSVAEPIERAEFWSEFPTRGVAVVATICRRMEPTFLSRVVSFVKRRLGL